MRFLLICCLGVLLAAGCKMSDNEVKEAAGNAAVNVKRATENAGEKLKQAYNDASIKGKEAMKDAGATLSDAALKVKVLAAFKLVKGLNTDKVKVDVAGGVVTLSGTVPTPMDKAKAEGAAYGVTGDAAKVKSTLQIQ